MPKFKVYAIFTATKFLGTFEAATAEEAEEIASESEENHASLCHQCSNNLSLDDYHASQFTVEDAK